MSKIRFLTDQVYETEGPNKGPKFAEGSTLAINGVGKALSREVSEDWAKQFLDRWVRRGAAIYTDGREVRAEEKSSATEPKALADMSAKELKAYATENNIDIGDAKKPEDILAAIQLAAEAKS